MIQTVLLKRVESYQNTEAIQSFVAQALLSSPEALRVLKDSNRDRLIVVKPNWVQQSHEFNPAIWEPVITHPTLIEAVVACIGEHAVGECTVSICDGPHAYADFRQILDRGGLLGRVARLRQRFPKLRIEVLDLRREICIRGKEQVILKVLRNPDDPRGYVAVNLGRASHFSGFAGEGHYYGADADTAEVRKHHHGDIQEYLFSGTVMSCDLFINLPKVKTHKKTGITCSLKNLVGVNGNKNWLPHHTEGTPSQGGDEFMDGQWYGGLERLLKQSGQRLVLRCPSLLGAAFAVARKCGKLTLGDSDATVRNGNWEGNDTCWRMVLDLNRALLYGRPDGSLSEGHSKAYVSIADGIIGGEGNGPLCPDPVNSGFLAAGTDPAAVDLVVTRLVGIDPDKLPMLRQSFKVCKYPLARGLPEDVKVFDCDNGTLRRALDYSAVKAFEPHFGWRNVREARSVQVG